MVSIFSPIYLDIETNNNMPNREQNLINALIFLFDFLVF